MRLPKEIRDVVGNQKPVRNDVGMSSSDVWVYSKHVLKIQEQSAETDNERDIAAWLKGQIPVPEIPVYCVENGTAYTLMTKTQGEMLCTEKYLNHPQQLIQLAAEGLRTLWKMDVRECPLQNSRLDARLKQARWNVEHGLVEVDDAEVENFGEGGFKDPEALLVWLEQNRPEEDLVLTHGDYCLPNIFVQDDKVCGFIDLGKMGPADRWQDLAIAIRSLHHNFSGVYSGGKSYFDFKPNMLLDELGIEMDDDKYKYYLLLDELF